MFQVLLNTGAAKTILCPTLAMQLTQEPFREELIAKLDLMGSILEERCAVVLSNIPASEIRLWADRLRMPTEVRDFCEIFSELCALIKKSDGVYQAVEVLAWFNRADVWRKPDRGQALLDLADQIGLKTAPLIQAMRDAQALNTANIIAGVAAQDRSNGERIGSAFELARLAAIRAALES
jgi:tRNA nucleotidyltransferase (CCA-adding enzyme)